MLDRLPEAEQQLARLDSLCIFGCAEYRLLKAAIADYKAGKSRPTRPSRTALSGSEIRIGGRPR